MNNISEYNRNKRNSIIGILAAIHRWIYSFYVFLFQGFVWQKYWWFIQNWWISWTSSVWFLLFFVSLLITCNRNYYSTNGGWGVLFELCSLSQAQSIQWNPRWIPMEIDLKLPCWNDNCFSCNHWNNNFGLLLLWIWMIFFPQDESRLSGVVGSLQDSVNIPPPKYLDEKTSKVWWFLVWRISFHFSLFQLDIRQNCKSSHQHFWVQRWSIGKHSPHSSLSVCFFFYFFFVFWK